MAIMKINTEQYVRGRMSICREKDDDGTIVTYGIFETHDYFENIHTLESERYFLSNVDIVKEDFGTNDYNIKYTFTAETLVIKDDYIPLNVKYIIENDMYRDEEDELFHSENFDKGLAMFERQEKIEFE